MDTKFSLNEQINEIFDIMNIQASMKKKKLLLNNDLHDQHINIFNDKNRIA